jgi:hypothetical protein
MVISDSTFELEYLELIALVRFLSTFVETHFSKPSFFRLCELIENSISLILGVKLPLTRESVGVEERCVLGVDLVLMHAKTILMDSYLYHGGGNSR